MPIVARRIGLLYSHGSRICANIRDRRIQRMYKAYGHALGLFAIVVSDLLTGRRWRCECMAGLDLALSGNDGWQSVEPT
jgi:hypothetical protein